MASLLDALIQQESGGRPGVLGPSTKWGRAMGLTQVLPSTGAEMAQKLGLSWRPDLMTAKTDEGADYQRRIGEAYLQEGLQKTGNTRDALRYYHGGPDRRQWGPKTNAYADQVLARVGQPKGATMQQPMPLPQDMLDQPSVLSNPGSLASLIQQGPMNVSPMDDIQAPKPKAFDKGGKGWVIAGIIADAIAGGFGGKGGFAPTYTAIQEDERQLAAWREKVAAERAERMQPKVQALGGGAFGMVDPRTGQVTPTYQPPPEAPAPTNAARMAVEMGLSPGTPEFVQFIRRYAERPIMIGGQPFGYEDSAPAAASQVIDGVTYYNVGGKWFDNPEGR